MHGARVSRGSNLWSPSQKSGEVIPLPAGGSISCGHIFLSVSDGDLEFFTKLQKQVAIHNVFIVGNGFGFSTLALAHIFSGAKIDVIDIGGGHLPEDDSDKTCIQQAINLTSRILRREKLPGHIHVGPSPGETHLAVRPNVKYDLVFIDGDHSRNAVHHDFKAILPYLAPSCVVVFHDRHLNPVCAGVDDVRASVGNQFRFRQVVGASYHNFQLTGFLHRGFSAETFASFSVEIPLGTDGCWMY